MAAFKIAGTGDETASDAEETLAQAKKLACRVGESVDVVGVPCGTYLAMVEPGGRVYLTVAGSRLIGA